MIPELGFRVLDGKTGARRLINWAAAFRAYAGCDERAELQRESYLSAFTYGDDFRRHLDTTGSTAAFNGVCHAPFVWWDIDRADDFGAALADARRLVSLIVERYRIGNDVVLIFASGAKGFHIGIPTSLWNPAPSVQFNSVAKRFAQGIAEAAGAQIDSGVYAKVQLFRAPNSRHPKTGRHKRRIAFDELMQLTGEYLMELATSPVAFEIPAPKCNSDKAAEDWAEAERLHLQAEAAHAERRIQSAGSPTLNRQTLDFITNGVAVGDRHRILFSAAANLAEFDCPEALAHALLTEAGRDSGLSPSEVRRQIECGLRHKGGRS